VSYRPRRPYEPGGPLIVATPPPRPLRDLTPSVRRLRRVRFDDPPRHDWTTLESYLPIRRRNPVVEHQFDPFATPEYTLLTIGPLPRGTTTYFLRTWGLLAFNPGFPVFWRLYASRAAPANFAALTDADITWPWLHTTTGGYPWSDRWSTGGISTTYPDDRPVAFDAYHTLVVWDQWMQLDDRLWWELRLPTLSPLD
jgi:hypothetical protein